MLFRHSNDNENSARTPVLGRVDYIWQWFPAEFATEADADGARWLLWPMVDYLENRKAYGDAQWSVEPARTPAGLLVAAQQITGQEFSAIEPAEPRTFRFASDPERPVLCPTYALVN